MTNHALRRAVERGADPSEIEEVLAAGVPIPARGGRLAKVKTFEFRGVREGHSYSQKRVEVYYLEEGDAAVVITVYVFYGAWGTT